MSADNGYIVKQIHNVPDYYGIFHYSGDGDNPPEYYTRDHAVGKIAYNSAVSAIVMAHIVNREVQTEYGVYVSEPVLDRAKLERLF